MMQDKKEDKVPEFLNEYNKYKNTYAYRQRLQEEKIMREAGIKREKKGEYKEL